MAITLISSGRMQPRETVLTGGVEAFPEALLGLYRGVNTGKLLLQVSG